MYFDALSFLEDERDAWRPFEALLDVADADFETPVEAAHGWSARELSSHLAAYQAMEAAWDERADAVNEELSAAWSALPVEEVRRRAREIPGELRGYLTVVPEVRWVKHEVFGRFFEEELLDHYADHAEDLRAITAAVG